MFQPHLRAIGLALLSTCVARGDVIWSQPGDGYANHGPSWRWPSAGADRQLADDFDVVGRIEQVRVGGATLTVQNLVLEGVYVRFYEYGPDDAPGALQAEYFVPVGGAELEYGTIPVVEAVWFLATLSPPFQATGRHFVSVQPQMDREWYWASSATAAPRGQRFYFRFASTLPWHYGDGDSSNNNNCDLNFRFHGVVTGPPRIDSLSAVEVARSGRLVIHGANFGTRNPDSQVRIGGIAAPTASWSESRVVAYVPEPAALGLADVEVVTAAGSSPPATITVSTRQPLGRVQWRFVVDDAERHHRPATGVDGRVYLSDSQGRLYALAADGALLWIFHTGGQADQTPPAIGTDGTVYFVSDPLGPDVNLYAVNPDGTLRWMFTDTNTEGIIAGPSIGPDGNVYASTDSGGIGLFSLTPDGALRWSDVGDPQIGDFTGAGAEIAFGPSQPAGPRDQLYLLVRPFQFTHLHAYGLAGDRRWAVPTRNPELGTLQSQGQAVVGQAGAVYHTGFDSTFGWALFAFEPLGGAVQWSYHQDPIQDLTWADVGPDGTIYIATPGRLIAVEPNGDERWRYTDFARYAAPIAGPSGDVIVVGGRVETGQPGFFRGFSAAGALLWEVPLGSEAPGYVASAATARFSHDGRTAYMSAIVANAGTSDPHAYLYAVTASDRTGDVNCDGGIDFFDIDPFLLALFDPPAYAATYPGCNNADVNGDGNVDFFDIDPFLACLFATCP